MTFGRHTVARLSVLVSLLFLVSCRPAWMNSFVKSDSITRMSRALRAATDIGGEYIQLTRTASASAVTEYRIRPSTTVTGTKWLDLAACRRIALANSLDIQQALAETAAKAAIERSNRVKLLPHLLVTGDLEERDNQRYSYSEVLGSEGLTPQPGTGGTGVNQFSTGTERGTSRWVIELRWSPTDAALAYYLAKSSRNDTRKQHFLRVRTAQRLLGVVDASYARLLSLRMALPVAEQVLHIRSDVARRMEDLFDQELVSVEEYHASKRKLIRARRQVSNLRTEAERQRNILASAMQLSPGYSADGGFRLFGKLTAPQRRLDMENAEMLAVKNRPEAYVAGLDHLNSVNDLRRTIVKYFPKITGFWKQTRDKDIHLYNKEWRDVGVTVYFDLVDWCSNMYEHDAAQKLAYKSYQEIGSVALGITAEVRAAVLKHSDALDGLRAARSSLASADKVWRVHRRRAARGASEQILTQQYRGDMLEEKVSKIRALGEVQATFGELQSSVGTNYNEPCPR